MGELVSETAILHCLTFLESFFFFFSQPTPHIPVHLYHKTDIKMTATPQNPGSLYRIGKRHVLFNPISPNDAEFPSMNWPDVPGSFAFLFQHILFSKVWINLQQFKWTALERASNQLQSQRKMTIFHYRIYISFRSNILILTHMASTNELQPHLKYTKSCWNKKIFSQPFTKFQQKTWSIQEENNANVVILQIFLKYNAGMIQ